MMGDYLQDEIDSLDKVSTLPTFGREKEVRVRKAVIDILTPILERFRLAEQGHRIEAEDDMKDMQMEQNNFYRDMWS
jgi:hypothetical protein